MQYQDTIPHGYRIHFSKVSDNVGKFDARGLPLGGYLLGTIPMIVCSHDSEDVSPMSLKELKNFAVGSKSKRDPLSLQRGRDQSVLSSKDPSTQKIGVEKLPLNETSNNKNKGKASSLSPAAVVVAASVPGSNSSSDDWSALPWASTLQTKIAWGIVQNFYLVAGKRAATTAEIAEFLQENTKESEDMSTSSVSIIDLSQTVGKHIAWQSKQRSVSHGLFFIVIFMLSDGNFSLHVFFFFFFLFLFFLSQYFLSSFDLPFTFPFSNFLHFTLTASILLGT